MADLNQFTEQLSTVLARRADEQAREMEWPR